MSADSHLRAGSMAGRRLLERRTPEIVRGVCFATWHSGRRPGGASRRRWYPGLMQDEQNGPRVARWKETATLSLVKLGLRWRGPNQSPPLLGRRRAALRSE